VLRRGTGGRHPRSTSEVTVNYQLDDGKMFDSSVVKGRPVTFHADGVGRGGFEGVPLMFEAKDSL
jgi:peptidylprolyl isomerase